MSALIKADPRGRSYQNPYLVQPGYSKRVSLAAGALHSLANSPQCRAPVQARDFDKCFAMKDGNAVVWELMNRVSEGDEALRRGISVLGSTVWEDWLRIYGAPIPRRPVYAVSTDAVAGCIGDLSGEHVNVGEEAIAQSSFAEARSDYPNRGTNFD